MQVFKKIGLGLAAMLASLSAYADYSWNFPEPVTPMALDTLHVHNKFMLISMAIFLVVLAIMIYSIIKHRKSKGYKAVADKAPSTAIEIFWTLIPFVILLLIDFVTHIIFCVEPICQLSPPLGVLTLIFTMENGPSL